MMKKSKKIAGRHGTLVAGILTESAIMEKKIKPILSLDERMEIAKSIKYFDKVILQETYSPLLNLQKIKPDILMESSSHTEKDLRVVKDYMKSINGKIITIPYYKGQSSSKIKNLIKNKG